MTAELKCRKCGALIIFAFDPRGRRVPLDARPAVLAVPTERGRLVDLPPAHRRIERRAVYRPHFLHCRAEEHRGRGAYVAGDDSDS